MRNLFHRLRRHLEAAELGIVPTPPELEQERLELERHIAEAAAVDAFDAVAVLQTRITGLEHELAEVRAGRAEARQELERHIAERTTAAKGRSGDLDLARGLQASNQRLRARLRAETDRADRAEARVAGLELTLTALAAADQNTRNGGTPSARRGAIAAGAGGSAGDDGDGPLLVGAPDRAHGADPRAEGLGVGDGAVREPGRQ